MFCLQRIPSLVIIVSTVITLIHGAHFYKEEEKVCHTSADCGQGMCCRETSGAMLQMSGLFDTIGPFGELGNGTCVPLLAQYGEHCNEHCPCDSTHGLECYRHFTDDRIESTSCREKSYVDRETKSWLACYHDPKCKLPS